MHARKGIGLKVIVALGTALLVGQGCARLSPSATMTPFITMPPAIVTKEPTPLPARVITPTPTELPANFLHRKIVYFKTRWPDPGMQLWAADPVSQQTIQLTFDSDGVVKIRLPGTSPWRLGVVTRTMAPQLTHESLIRFSPPVGWAKCGICVLSSSGGWLAYAPFSGLFVVDMTNGRVEEVLRREYQVDVVSVRWLSSGRGFSYSIGGEMMADYHVFDPVTGEDTPIQLEAAVWNVADTRVAGLKHDPRVPGWATNDVLVFELDTGRTYSAASSADETLPVWAPDGRHVFYMRRTITASKVPGENDACYGQTREWALAGPAEIWWLDSGSGRSSPVLRSGLFNYMVERVIEDTVVVKTAPYEPRSFDQGCGPSDFAPGGYTEGDNFVLNLSTLKLEPYDRSRYEPRPPREGPPPVTVFEDPYGSYRVEYRQDPGYGASGGRVLAALARQDADADACFYNEGSLWKVWQDGSGLQLVESGCFFTYLP